jgi:hypothetical protein
MGFLKDDLNAWTTWHGGESAASRIPAVGDRIGSELNGIVNPSDLTLKHVIWHSSAHFTRTKRIGVADASGYATEKGEGAGMGDFKFLTSVYRRM